MGCGASRVSSDTLEIIRTDPDPIGNETIEQTYFKELTDRIRLVSKPRDVSSVLCMTDKAFPLVACPIILHDNEISSIFLPIISAATFRKGKIVCFGSTDFLSTEYINCYDTPELINKCIFWGTDGRKKQKICVFGIDKRKLENVTQLLESSDFSVFAVDSLEKISNFTVLITTSNLDVSNERDMSSLLKYISVGGFIMCFSENDVKKNEFPINEFLLKVGLGFIKPDVPIKTEENRTPVNISFSTLRPFYLEGLISKLEFQLSNEDTLDSAELDKIAASLRFFILLCNEKHYCDELLRILYACLDFLKGTDFDSPGGVCITFPQSIMAVLITQLLYKIPMTVFKDMSFVSESFMGKPNLETSTYILEMTVSPQCWNSTGLWLPAGFIGAIKTDVDFLTVQIGSHTESLLEKEGPWDRWPYITMSYQLKQGVTKVSSPFGGIVYIGVTDEMKKNCKVEITFDGFARHPRALLDHPEVYEETKNIDVPWGELESELIVFTLPAFAMKNVDTQLYLKKMDGLTTSLAEFLRVPIKGQYRVVFDAWLPAEIPLCGYPLFCSVEVTNDIISMDETGGIAILLPLALSLMTEERFDLEFETTLAAIAVSDTVKAEPKSMRSSGPDKFAWLWDVYAADNAIISRVLDMMGDHHSNQSNLAVFIDLLRQEGNKEVIKCIENL